MKNSVSHSKSIYSMNSIFNNLNDNVLKKGFSRHTKIVLRQNIFSKNMSINTSPIQIIRVIGNYRLPYKDDKDRLYLSVDT